MSYVCYYCLCIPQLPLPLQLHLPPPLPLPLPLPLLLLLLPLVQLIYIFFFYFPIAIPVSGWNVSIFHHSPNVLTLQWTSLDRVYNHHAEFYIVEVKSIQGTILTAETVYQNATSAIIKGLWPSTLYLVGVFGVDSTGQPYKSSETITSTKEGR